MTIGPAQHAVLGMGVEQLFRQLPGAVLIAAAPTGEVLLANDRAREVSEGVLGKPLPGRLGEQWNIFHPDGRPYTAEEWPLMRCITTGEEVTGEEYFHVLPDGSRLVLRCNCSAIRDEGGRIVAGMAISTDVTEEKRVEEQLAYHAGLLGAIDDAVIATDASGAVTVWNGGAERLYGRPAADALGRPLVEVVPTDLDPTQRIAVRRALDRRGRWRGELVARCADGSTVDVEAVTVAIGGADDAVTGELSIHRDITDRRRAEARLRASHRRIETILESITDDFVAVDRAWRLTYVNSRALARLRDQTGLELTRDDVIGRDWWSLAPELAGTPFEQHLRRAADERASSVFETYLPRGDVWLEVHAYPTEDGVALYARDIGERKRAARELERRARQQAVVASLGVRALGGERLQGLMDAAATLVARTVGVELTAVAELLPGGEEVLWRAGAGWRAGAAEGRTEPSGPGTMAGAALATGEPVVHEDLAAAPAAAAPDLAREHGAVSGVTVVIGGRERPFGVLAALARRRRRFAADDVHFLQSVANVLATAAEHADAERRVREAREGERRRIARDLHDEVLRDLGEALARARGAAPPDALAPLLERAGRQLRAVIHDLRLTGEQERPFGELLSGLVALHGAMGPEPRIVLDVRDGLPARPLGTRGTELLGVVGEAVTNARRHAGATTIRIGAWGSTRRLCLEVADDGHGFDPGAPPTGPGGSGLAGMRERAALIGADLTVRSRPGAGTRVRVEVPLDDAAPPSPGEAPVRVLLVDDHAAMREAVAFAFERAAGFSVVGQAASLAEARSQLEGVDVAVVDLGLPDGYGADLIAELREASPHAQALVLSASLDRGRIADAVERGAAAVLHKTVPLDQVVDAVRRLRAGETLLPLDEVVELLRYAGRRREAEQDDRRALARLTPRELEVLRALGEGLDSQAVAERLHITVRTERNHVASILAKLGVHSQLQALVFALRYGVVEIGPGPAPR